MGWRPGRTLDRERAEELAVAALTFLGSDGERLARFLALSGLTPASLRAAAREPGFLSAVLDHLAGDERLTIAFAEAEGCDPGMIAAARDRLSQPI
jgi:hypothetical protein